MKHIQYIILAGLFAFVGSVSAANLENIKFPIAELGNCGSQEECKTYCDNTANMRQCVAFAREMGIMRGTELEEAEKVLRALDAGASLPPGCTSQATCKNVCENPKDMATMRACFDFGEKAGLLPPDAPDRAQAEKMFTLIESGKAPFSDPRDFKKCENPESDEIMEKCVNFGIEMGMVSEEDAAMFRKTRGKGPGGCRGKEQCDAYCGANEEECIKFAEDNDLLSPERKEQMKQNATRISESVRGAPEEAKACLEQNLGTEKVAQMESGALRMTRELGEKIKTCFENAGPPEGEYRGESGPERPGRPSGQTGQEGGFSGPGNYEGVRPPEGQYSDEGRYRYPPEDMRLPEGTYPNDYRPEGTFPQPESYNRPPERELETYTVPDPTLDTVSPPEQTPVSEPNTTSEPAPAESAPTSRLDVPKNNFAAAFMSLLSGFFSHR